MSTDEPCCRANGQARREEQFLYWCSDNGVEAPALRMATFEQLRGVEAAVRIEPGALQSQRCKSSALFRSGMPTVVPYVILSVRYLTSCIAALSSLSATTGPRQQFQDPTVRCRLSGGQSA